MLEIEKGFYIQKSNKLHKKYDIYKRVNGEYKYMLSFGGDPAKYEHYKDNTPIKAFSHLDHYDRNRQQLYYARHGLTRSKSSAKYWSNKYLW